MVTGGKGYPLCGSKGREPGGDDVNYKRSKRCRRLARGFQKVKCASRPIGVAGQPKTRYSFARVSKSNAITPFRESLHSLLFAGVAARSV